MIEARYNALCLLPSDIWEHLPTLKKYAEQSETIVELGVRGIVSTWALLAGKPKQLISVDIEHPKTFGGDLLQVEDVAREAGIEFDFVLKSSLEIDLPEHDMLFIDTIHTKEFLSQELERHHSKVKKFIAFHDTNRTDFPEMFECIETFLREHPEWLLEYHTDSNNGMTVIKRI